MYKAQTKKRKLIIGLAVVGVVGGAVATIATGGVAAPVVGGVAGGVIGYGAGKGNEKIVKKRIKETRFDHDNSSNMRSVKSNDSEDIASAQNELLKLAFQNVVEVRRSKFEGYLKQNQF